MRRPAGPTPLGALAAPRVALAAALLAALAAASATGPAYATTLTRHPSLWKTSPMSVVVSWQTDVDAPGKILYGTTPAFGSEIEDPSPTTDHVVEITGLTPHTRYHYKIVSDVDSLTPGDDTLRTAPDGAAHFRFVAFGDCGTGDVNQYDMAARIDALDPDLGIIMGDVIYEYGEAQNFTPRYFTPYRSTLRRAVFYPVVGNHDIITANGQPFLQAFHLPTNSADGTEKYYSFDYGNAHFVAIDGNQVFNGDMYDWVDADLAATGKRWKFVYFHQPMYSNPGTHGSDLNLRFYLEPMFMAHGVDVVFQGHNHYFSRSYPIANGAAVDTAQGSSYHDVSGIIYLVSGGGGRGLHPLAPNDPLTRSAYSLFHTLVVDVEGDSVYIQAVKKDGTVFDSLSITKSAPTAVEVQSFEARSEAEGIRVSWRAAGSTPLKGFNLYRAASEYADGDRLNRAGLLTGGPDFSFLDREVEPGQAYVYRLGAVDQADREEILGIAMATASGAPRFAIKRARPNPFNRETELSFTLPGAERVRVTILDTAGRRIRSMPQGRLPSGAHAVRWDGRDDHGRPAASGIYFARVEAGDRVLRTRLALLR